MYANLQTRIESAAYVVVAQPTVLHLADETLRGKLDGLASLLLLDDGSIPTDRTYSPSARVSRARCR